MVEWIVRMLRAAGVTIDEVTVVVLPSQLGEVTTACKNAELRWNAGTESWALVRTEIANVSAGAFAQRGPHGEQ